jgi:tetratricopeptide (TPR) repeat protein
MRARIDHERRTYLWCTGREIEALALGDRSVDAVALLARGGGIEEREFAASALTVLARQAFMCGRFDQARKRLDLAKDAQSRADHLPVWARINVLIFSGVLRTMTTGPQGVPHDLMEASALAIRHGLTELVVLAAIALSVDDQMRGDANTALARMDQVLPLAREACSNLNVAHVCLRLAELRIAAGAPQSALQLLKDARNVVPARNYTWTYNSLLAAYAYAATRDFHSARREAENAASAARLQRNERIEGVSMLALADSLIGLNVKSEAVEAVENAIDCLERCGYPPELLRAYSLAGLLTGRRRFTERARELEHVGEHG